MGKDSTLYQLMDIRMNSVINGIVSGDGEYQQFSRKSFHPGSENILCFV